MRRRLIFAVSAGLNVALAAILFMSSRHTAPAPATIPARIEPSGTNHARLQAITRKQFFVWQELESADYPTYIANLRSIVCPEQTIRDIIVADVNQLYARKRITDVVTPDQQWWRSIPDTNVLQAANAKLQALDQERRNLLTTLLGPNWESTDPAARSYAVALNGPVLGDIAPEMRDAVEDIAGKSQKRVQDYLDELKKSGGAIDPAELAKLDQQTRSELAQVLTPAQLEEYLLRYSQTASGLRASLAGVTVTPDEFKRLFDASDSADQQLLTAGAGQKTALEQQLQTTLQGVLGPDRYQAYLTSQDPAYRDAVAVAQKYGASADVVQNLYELNQATQDELDRIRNDSTLTPEQKAEQIKEAQQEQADARNELLGLTPVPPPQPPAPAAAPTQVHAYSPGETIAQIADQTGTTPTAILNANPNLDFNNLQRGALIKIPQAQ